MTEFDRKVKELAGETKVPESYDEKLDQVLAAIREKEGRPRRRKAGKWAARAAVCMLVAAAVLFLADAFHVNAGIADFFRRTIMDFFGGGGGEAAEEKGVGRDLVYVESKPDLMMELRETVIDTHSIYLLVQITAPADVAFTDHVGFDYFCFCEGENYSVNRLLGGSTSCELLEVQEEKPNMAIYVVSLVYDQELAEGSMVTACFKDLMADPYSDRPQMLVEGMWSLTFPISYTVTENVVIDGTEDMAFSFLDTTAVVERIELTPSVLVVRSDVTSFPYDQLSLVDTRINYTLKLLDGSELVIQSRDPDVTGFIQGGSCFYDDQGEQWFQQDTMEFNEIIDIGKVAGIYVEDLYIPLKGTEQ